MQDTAAPAGLMGLDIITPSSQVEVWLRKFSARGLIGDDTLREARLRFGLRRGKADWLLFLRRIFMLLGVLLLLSGLIFFMAWNWEDLSRFAKFALLEGVFVALAAYSIARWGSGPTPRWDARVALAGVGLAVGGLLALYGQVYQTGAEPWELFRAWTILLVIIALPGRATAFWFMVWITACLWIFLYLGLNFRWLLEAGSMYLLLAISQFALLAVNEAAAALLGRFGIRHDPGRWLSRAIGCLGIVLITAYAFHMLDKSNYRYYAEELPAYARAAYFVLMGLGLVVYYRLIPDLFLLSLCLFSLAAYACTRFAYVLFDSLRDVSELLVLGLFILALAFGCLKLILFLRKRILQREAARPPRLRLGEFFKPRAARRDELKSWLLERQAAPAEEIEACFAEDEEEHQQESPWYAKLFISIGVWVGSAVSLAALTFLLFEGLSSPQPLGLLGLLFCGISIQMGHGKSLAARAFSQVLGICGLIYSVLLCDFAERPTAALLAALFLLFWLFKPPFAARLGAFTAALVCIFLFIGFDSYSHYHQQAFALPFYLKTALYTLGLLWGACYLGFMESRPPARFKNPQGQWLGKRLRPDEIFAASAYAALLFFAALVIIEALTPPSDFREIAADTRLGSVLVFAACTALAAWRYPSARAFILLLGILLAVLAWFAPYLAVGFGLLLLAYQSGAIALLGAAVPYLGFGVFFYYYNLELSLLYKSLVLMGSGALLLVFARFALRPAQKEGTTP